jgi:hypothetical protein
MKGLRFLALLVLLAGCAPMLQPQDGFAGLPPATAAEGGLVFSDAGGGLLLNSYLPLAAPPGSVISEQTYSGKNSFSRFTNPRDFDEVRRFLLAALKASGWQLLTATIWETPPNLYQTTVRVARDGEQKIVIIRLENGRYSVEVREG